MKKFEKGDRLFVVKTDGCDWNDGVFIDEHDLLYGNEVEDGVPVYVVRVEDVKIVRNCPRLVEFEDD